MSTTITVPTIVTEPGWWEGMDDATYHGDPVPVGSLSYSMAKRLLEPGGPARWAWEQQHGRPHKAAFDFGRAAHAMVLGVGEPIAMIPADLLGSNGSANTKAAREFIEQARADGATPLKPDDARQVQDMAKVLEGHREAMRLLDGMHEVSAFDQRDGLWVRGRFDAITAEGVADYKTVTSAAPDGWAKASWDYRYHMQAAHYTDLAASVGLIGPDAPVHFIAQEKAAPYLVAVYSPDDAAIRAGRDAMARALRVWARCRDTDQWPGYPATTTTYSLPAWAPLD